ncbi:MAG: STAS domain-containing protein [Polyangiaceae bacterium]
MFLDLDMLIWLERTRSLLEALVLRILREHISDHGSALPPFRLPPLARQIMGEVVPALRGETSPSAAHSFGEKLGSLGLGLRSWLAVDRALTSELVGRATGPAALAGEVQDAALVLSRMHSFGTHVVEGLSRQQLAALSRERDEIHASLERVTHTREEELRQVIQELSIPVVPVFSQVLVVPLIGAIDDERARRITERILGETTRRKARFLIIDVTGVSASDAAPLTAISRTVQAVQLLGSQVVLVGIPAEMAQMLAHLDVGLTGIFVLANLQVGIEWALRQLGLSVQRRVSPTPPIGPADQPRLDKRSNQDGD